MIDAAVTLLATSWAVRAGVPVIRAGAAAWLIVATWGATWSLLAGGSPLRLLLGYRLAGRDGGPAPVVGVLLRETGRPVVGLALVVSAGTLGSMVSARTEHRMRQLTRTHVVGIPRRKGVIAVAVWGALVAVVALGSTLGEWGGTAWVDALGAMAVVGAAFGGAMVGLARVEIGHLERVGELEDAERAVTRERDLPLVVEHGLPERTHEVGWPVDDRGSSSDGRPAGHGSARMRP